MESCQSSKQIRRKRADQMVLAKSPEMNKRETFTAFGGAREMTFKLPEKSHSTNVDSEDACRYLRAQV